MTPPLHRETEKLKKAPRGVPDELWRGLGGETFGDNWVLVQTDRIRIVVVPDGWPWDERSRAAYFDLTRALNGWLCRMGRPERYL